MIKGLVEQKLTIGGVVYQYPDNTAIVAKINELTDAVNSLRDDCNLLMGYIAPENGCEPTDEDLREMIKDPKYWKEQDPETVRKVELAFQKKYGENTQNSTNNVKNSHLFQENEQKDHKIRSTNERLREALSLAENALIRLANDAYCMDEHIYIDGILNQIEYITKGGKDE